MRVAKHHKAGLRVAELLLKVGEINVIFAILIDKRTFDDKPPVVDYRVEEHVVNRRLY